MCLLSQNVKINCICKYIICPKYMQYIKYIKGLKYMKYIKGFESIDDIRHK